MFYCVVVGWGVGAGAGVPVGIIVSLGIAATTVATLLSTNRRISETDGPDPQLVAMILATAKASNVPDHLSIAYVRPMGLARKLTIPRLPRLDKWYLPHVRYLSFLQPRDQIRKCTT